MIVFQSIAVVIKWHRDLPSFYSKWWGNLNVPRANISTLIIIIAAVVVDSGFMTLLTSQVISVAFYNEREKSDKFCSEALISAWVSFTSRKSTTRDPRLYFPSERSHRPTQDFYALKKSIDPGRVWTRELIIIIIVVIKIKLNPWRCSSE